MSDGFSDLEQELAIAALDEVVVHFERIRERARGGVITEFIFIAKIPENARKDGVEIGSCAVATLPTLELALRDILGRLVKLATSESQRQRYLHAKMILETTEQHTGGQNDGH